MGDPLVARFDVTDEDVIAVYRHTMRSSNLLKSVRRRNLRNTAIAWLIVVAGMAGTSYWRAPNAAAGLRAAAVWVVAYAMIGPIVAWWICSSAASQKRMDRIIERAIRSGTLNPGRGPEEVRLDDDQVLLISADGTIAKPWTAIKDIEDAEDGVYFAFTDGWQFRVPSRAFATDEQRAVFVRAARERVTAIEP